MMFSRRVEIICLRTSDVVGPSPFKFMLSSKGNRRVRIALVILPGEIEERSDHSKCDE